MVIFNGLHSMKVLHSVMCTVQAMLLLILILCCLFDYCNTQIFFIIFCILKIPLYIEHSLQSPINRLFVVLLGSCNSDVSCLNVVFLSCLQSILLFFSIFYFSILFSDVSHSFPSILSHSFSLLNPAFWPSTPYLFLASLVSLSPLTH